MIRAIHQPFTLQSSESGESDIESHIIPELSYLKTNSSVVQFSMF
jgi:hypothetical protein